MRRALAAVILVLALDPARAEAAPCPANGGAMTMAETALVSLFDAIDDAGRAAFDAAMPGDEISFVRRGGTWRASIPRAAAARARANGCDLAASLEEAAAFYGPSLDLSDVRIIVGDAFMPSSFVFHNRVKIGGNDDPCPRTRTVVHELAHVWQHQHGQWQATMGLADQIRNHWVDVYDLEPRRVIAAARQGRRIDFFIRERQAELFATAWEIRTGRAGPIDPEYARAVLALVEPALTQPPTWR